jgi:hypothetical protein
MADVKNATEEQLEYNAYLLEIIRSCGLFKCTDCIYARWEDRGYGMEYKCCHPRTLPHSAWNDLETAMRGSACDAFEPSGESKRHLVERMTKTQDAVNELWKYARDKTEWTPMRETADERRLMGAMHVIEREGMVRL